MGTSKGQYNALVDGKDNFPSTKQNNRRRHTSAQTYRKRDLRTSESTESEPREKLKTPRTTNNKFSDLVRAQRGGN